MELQSHLVSTPKCLFLISMPVSCGVVLSQYHDGRSRCWHMPVSSKKKDNSTSQEKSTGGSNVFKTFPKLSPRQKCCCTNRL